MHADTTEIFTDELVSIKKHTVKLLVAPDANPKFHPVPCMPQVVHEQLTVRNDICSSLFELHTL